MNKDEIKEVKKHKPKWVPFFACAIMMGSGVNIIHSIGLLIVIRNTHYIGSYTSGPINSFGVKVFLSTLLIVVSLAVFISRMPVAVRLWEYKEWGRRITMWLSALAITMVPLSVVITRSVIGFRPKIEAFLLLEGIVLNALVIWYFSRSKIKSVFVK